MNGPAETFAVEMVRASAVSAQIAHSGKHC